MNPLPYFGGGAVPWHPAEPGVVTYNPEVPPAVTFQPDPQLAPDYVYSPSGILVPAGDVVTPENSVKVVMMLAAAALGLYIVTK